MKSLCEVRILRLRGGGGQGSNLICGEELEAPGYHLYTGLTLNTHTDTVKYSLYTSQTVWTPRNNLLYLGCPRNEKKNVSVRTETNRNKICFAFVSVCFVKPKQIFFGLFRCFESILKQSKQTELFRNEPKQSRIF